MWFYFKVIRDLNGTEQFVDIGGSHFCYVIIFCTDLYFSLCISCIENLPEKFRALTSIRLFFFFNFSVQQVGPWASNGILRSLF